MTRRYHSPRRAAMAEQTRLDIVEAAIRLHAGGVTEFADLAREAGVALPTVRKHFPTRERVFEACTAHIAETGEPFPLADLARISDPARRISASVRRLYQLFEARLGLTWTAYRMAGDSPAFAHVLERNQALIRRIAEMLVDGSGAKFPDGRRDTIVAFVRGLLSPLAFRAMRLEGGLDVDSAADHAAETIGRALEVHPST
jgi:AcrR family transcriptional regulator